METDSRDIYSASKTPLPPGSGPQRLRGLLLATLPSLVYFMFERKLIYSLLPGFVAMIVWCGVVILTFYGVGVLVWGGKAQPTWGRAAVAVLITGAWIELVGYVVWSATVVFWNLGN